MANSTRTIIRERVAPARFVLFLIVFIAVGVAAYILEAGVRSSLLIGFDVAAVVFLGAIIPLLRADADAMRRTASANDTNRVALLGITVLISLVILIAVGTLIASRSTMQPADVVLIVTTLALTWLFANTVFTLHYAHLFYLQSGGHDRRGLEVPNVHEPVYWDFVYFAFTLGMTFQTSDITIDGPHMRRVALVHCLVAFILNMGVIAFVVNALGGR